MSDWKSKIALVTGGSAGFGKRLTKALVDSGAHVVVVARKDAGLQEVASEFGEDRITSMCADVTNREQVERVFESVSSRFGRLDALFNIAGKSTRNLILEENITKVREMWEANFLGAFHCVQVAAPLLTANRGSVVLMGSLAGKVAAKHLGAYPISKFPLTALAQQMRLENREKGIHVLLVCPGPIRREDQPTRYDSEAANLPESARKPGGGAKIKGIDPDWLARKVLWACERRKSEIVIPKKARLLFAIAQLWPDWGDWLLERYT